MANAEEMLAAALGEETADNKVLTVDLETRTIIIPTSVQNLGVESDDDVLRIDFSMPRYCGDIDLDAFTKQINYLNARGYGDVYQIKDAVATEDTITFSWLVGRFAAAYEGNVNFNLCFKQYGHPNDNTIVTEEFNTTVATLPILKGLETSEAIVQNYSDVLVAWENQLFGIGDTEEAQIRNAAAEEKAAIQTTSEGYLTSITERGNEVLSTIDSDVEETVLQYCTDNGMQVPTDDHIRALIAEYLSGDVTVGGTLTAAKVIGAVYE